MFAVQNFDYFQFIPWPVRVMYGVALVVWLGMIVLGFRALVLAGHARTHEVTRALRFSVLVLIVSLLGTTVFNVSYSYHVTSGGHTTGLDLDSRPFFIVPLVIGVVALIRTLTTRSRLRSTISA